MSFVDLRSDTVTLPTPEMREAMFNAEVGDDVFGEDPTISKLESRVAELLGKEAALYVPSGTMANQIAIFINTNPGDEVYCEAGCHFFNYEGGAPSIISGVQLHPIQGKRGIFTREQIEERLRPGDHHFPPSSMIAVENTCNRGGGTVWPIREIHRIYELSREQGMAMHLDGARLWNATAASGTSEKDWAKFADTVSVCLSKGLGAPVGSVLASTKEKIEQAHHMRKRLGGGMRQAGIIAAGGLYAIENHRERLVNDHRRAKILAKGLKEIQGMGIDPDYVDTNIIILDLSERLLEAVQFIERLKENEILVTMAGRMQIRLVTHLGISDNDIDRTLEVFKRLLN